MISYLVLGIVFIAFLLACFEDIRKREVYDYLNFSFAFIILITALFDSIITSNFDPIKYSAFGMIIGFGLGAILFYAGIWGGGDAKFLLGFSAATYYIKDLVISSYSTIGFYYAFVISRLNVGFEMFLNTFLTYIQIIDIIFLIFVLIQFLLVKRKSEKLNLLFLFTTLLLLLTGIYLDLTPINLVIIAFTVFILIFFAKEGTFDCVYIKYKKYLKDLIIGNKINDNIRINKKTIIKFEDGKFGLTREQIHKIKKSTDKKTKLIDVYVRKSLPFGILIILNFVTYLIKIITIERTNLEILSYMFKYLFFSFMAGGVLAVFVVFYYFIKNYKQVKIKISKLGWSIIIFFIIVPIITHMVYGLFLTIAIIPLLYIFIKIAIGIEHVAFVSAKKLENIVLGDWIVQNIYDKKQLIYQSEDFKIGVDEIQLAKIKELAKTNPNLSKIKVKDGIAFLPALFIGFLALFYFK